MKIEVFGKTEVVYSVYAEKINIGLRVIINLRERSSYVHRCGCSVLYLSKFKNEALEHQAFEVYANNDEEPACEIVLIAENEKEKTLISNIEYSNKCKDQWIYLFINDNIHEDGELLSTYRGNV